MEEMNFVEELRWRGLLHDIMPGTEEQLQKEMTAGYVGFDPTADSLHIGNMVPIMLLVHFQRCGHKPIALVGGATGMVGDPSGKSAERQLLDTEQIEYNLNCQKKQLEHFLQFEGVKNNAEIVNNYDWFKEFSFLDFIRDVGKHITVNYMMAKDSVKNRLESGMSFTEFSYQLVQGYDFYHLHKNKSCKLQMGGSDQWGNIVTGTELIRRKGSGEAFAITAPLLMKADGTKMGKSEGGGNIWLDAKKTSPYKFYQFWLNVADEDIKKSFRIFSLKNREEIEAYEKEHDEAPERRLMQKALAEELTVRIHSQEAYDMAVEASSILFGKSTSVALSKLSEDDFHAVFEGVPTANLAMEELDGEGLDIVELLASKSGFLSSNGEARRSLKENAISVNKSKVSSSFKLKPENLLLEKYAVLQRGKKNYLVAIFE